MKAKRFLFRAPAIFGASFSYGAPVFIGFTVIISGLDAHAGDILRGGAAASGGGPRTGTSASVATPAATDAARANARDVLARTNRTLGAVQAMQNAARQAAIKGANSIASKPNNSGLKLPVVPNGLGKGGLQVSPTAATDPTQWTGANAPVQTVSKGKTTVTIKQTEQQALLNWDTFNVGKKTTLTFDQSAGGADTGKWIAFNKINDPTGSPTQILGSIKADGQVYIINQNGIIFGGSSQVNARGLTVSSLPINDNLVQRGLLNNPDAQFLFSGLDLVAGAHGTPAFTPQRPFSPDGKYGDVIVEQGAILQSPTDSAHVGGRITLVGPNVDNQGTILTPDGQTILASGLQVGFFAHSSTDPSLRGLDVFVGGVTDPTAGLYAGTVTQQGLIEAQRGAITIVGRQINQLGVIESSTSVSLNGRVDLIAGYNAISNTAYDLTGSSGGAPFLYQSSGTVEIGDGSVIRILPELDSKETTIGTELALRSQVNISGKAIHLGKDSVLLAPNALVDLSAGEWFLQQGSSPTSTFIPSTGQIYLDENALVDVSGTADVAVPVGQNIISVDLRGAELADSPLQRDGILRNATVQVDIRDQGIYQNSLWLGTPLANLSGFANLIQKSVGQLTVAGGSVNMSAGASVVMQAGSKVDVSGGSIQFQGGVVKTTQLISAGRLVDISKATPDVVYSGIYDGTHKNENIKFGVSEIYHMPLAPDGSYYEPGSIQGGAGGKLSISAPSMALDGGLMGRTTNGDGQRSTPATPASLSLSFLAKDRTYQTLPDFSPTPPELVIGSFAPQSPAGSFALDAEGNPLPLAAERIARVQLSPDIMTGQGFGMLTLNNPDGGITLPAGVTLNAPAGGVISMKASTIDIEGAITAPGGKITFQCPNISLNTLNALSNSTSAASLPDAVDGAGVFTLGNSASVSTAGLLVDDRLNMANTGRLPLFLDGGSIAINAFSAELSAGGSLDVSGGASVDPRGSVAYGKGGSLAVTTGRDLNISGVLGGHLSLGASMKGFSGISAGSLSIGAPAIQIGGHSSNPGVTLLQQDFFNQGGFGAFSLTGTGLASDKPSEFVTGIRITSGADIHPIVTGLTAVTGDGAFALREVTQVEGIRAAGSVSFSALSGTDPYTGALLGRGDLVMEQGAVIRTDAKGSVSLSGDTVALSGSVITPGGTINIAGAGNFPGGDPNQYLPTVLIGGTASLSAAGETLLIQNPLGLRQGQVLAGGSVAVVGNIVSERGAVIDVSGTSGILDLPPSRSTLDPELLKSLSDLKTVPVTVSSNGGQITLTGAKMLYSDATLIGRAGGPSAIGGTVTVSSGRFVEVGAASNSAEANLVVRQDGFLVPADFVSHGPGVTLTDESGAALPGIGHFNVSTFKSGGFDSLALNGNVKFEGDVAIHVPGALRVSSGGAIYGDGKINLTAAYVNLGQAFTAPRLPTEQFFLFTQTDTSGVVSGYTFSPTHGNANLQVNAGLIDIGNLSLQGIGSAAFNAADGDIRGNGTIDAAGSLTFKAGQIYPTTAGRFDIFAYDFVRAGATIGGSISIESGSDRQLPLSAGGTLGVYASRISQGGTLRAPLGTIQLGWDGTGTAPADPIAGDTSSSPATSLLTLKSGGLVSVSAVDPVTGKGSIIPYGISLDGNSWIDPAGNDITVNGLPAKTVNLGATELVTEKGSTVDVSGGGDLYAYRWVSGNGGTKDVLASSGAFAVIPGYSADYAPYAPFNPNTAATNLGGQSGYVNSTLKVGDKITLAAGSGLAAGSYTLLPARYALLPGAFLITPQSTAPASQTVKRADGSWIATGYRSNDLDASRSGATLIGVFEVASSKVVRQRAEYQDFLADTVIRNAALSRGFTVPRLPVDAGYLSFSSSAGMTLHGSVTSITPESGLGSVIDINSSANILINDSGKSDNGGDLVLSTDLLNSFGAQSLLVGGIRRFTEDGSEVTINTSNLTLDRSATALTGSDVILVAKDQLHLTAGSAIHATGSGDGLDNLLIGNADDVGSGDGTLVRVSGSVTAPVIRKGVSSSESPNLIVGSSVSLTGRGIVMDSTFGTSIDSSAVARGNSVALSSGRISVVLADPGTLQPNPGLVLSGDALAVLQSSAENLSLLSYSSLDFYGTGTVGTRQFDGLSLHAASIRGFNTSGGNVNIAAKNLLIDNPSGNPATSPLAGGSRGSLTFEADEITLGTNDVHIEGFSKTSLVSDVRVLVSDTGSFSTAGKMDLVTPLVTGEGNSKYSINADDLMQVRRTGSGAGTGTAGGLGSDLTISGGTVKVNTDIVLPSGSLTLHATSGDLVVGNLASTRLDLGGTQSRFLDLSRYSDGGTVNLAADKGSVRIEKLSDLSVSACAGGGDAGAIDVYSPNGDFSLLGSIHGSAGSSGLQGGFSLDASGVPGGSLAGLDGILNDGSFSQLRDYRIRTGDVTLDGSAVSHIYQVAADDGDIIVSGTINAAGATGGTIDLKAGGSLTMLRGASLDASGRDFDAAGKGGAVILEAGNQHDGVAVPSAVLDLQTGSSINLSVAAADATSESKGRFTGTLHLRAPRNESNSDLRISAIGATIHGASSILVEGVKLYGVTGTGTIDSTLQTGILNDANAFLGEAGSASDAYTSMLRRLTAGRSGLDLILAPGVEVYNLDGNITLGSEFSDESSDWNLASYRFGPRMAPGVLTLRASRNLTFFNALSDGFSGGVGSGPFGSPSTSLWQAILMANNPALPANAQSWSFHLTAGADLSGASYRAATPLASLDAGAGLFQLGKDAGAATAVDGTYALTSSVIAGHFQVIRTGSGDIDIHAGRSLQLLNPFASIYTAGTALVDPQTVSSANDFVIPNVSLAVPQGNLGPAQQAYLAQYSMAGGNVSITAGDNIERKTLNNSGLIDDSSRQLPNNWLYRRGLVGPDGEFGKVTVGSGFLTYTDEAASTTWWVDFSNFFQGVGALGGGNVSLSAGHDVANVDAVIPTNARAAQGTPSAAAFLELGGGNLVVRSGNNISGGVYYVERGHGTLDAGGSITTNATRSPSFGLTTNLNDPATAILDPLTWLPTTLFVGDSSFDLKASGDILMGPVANPFLLPQGLNNRYWYKSYFSTLTGDSGVSATSLGGEVTVRNAVTLPEQSGAEPVLRAWYESQLLLTSSASTTAWFQPWLRLAETNLGGFTPVWSLSASNLYLSSLAGNVNLAGDITLNPSPTGQLEIVAAGAVNALRPTGLSNFLVSGRAVQSWTSATVNLSDANPDSIPSALSPLTSFAYSSTAAVPTSESGTAFMAGLASLFTESGSSTGTNAVLETRQSRHTPGGLHSEDHDPLRIYALGGDLSGLTLYSGKSARISAATDLTDLALYIQNSNPSDVSVVSAGRDIVASDSSSPLRIAAFADGNALSVGQPQLSGDIQISGPGTLEVIAGRNLDLGTGTGSTDGTGTGITSIGSLRNPYLAAKGSSLVVAAGVGPAASLSSSQLALHDFISEYVSTPQGEAYLKDLAPGVDFSALDSEEQALLALEVFYRILRDTGRDFNDPESPGYRKYDAGFVAIKTLFPEATAWDGAILTQSRDIRTRAGGDIGIIAPGGGLKMSETTIGNPLTPPGIITETGGGISLFTDQSVNIGIGRIFTLRGGDVVIWSSKGDIAAGSSSRTIQSAPPTRVIIDPQSASVETDLAGLATGGGIGVLATVAGVKPGDVDLIAPTGIIDAGDAGIRVTGNINLAAVSVVNAGNISAGGTSTGAPAAVSAPSVSTIVTASQTSVAPGTTVTKPDATTENGQPKHMDDSLSDFTVEVIGYGGGDSEEEDKDKKNPSLEQDSTSSSPP